LTLFLDNDVLETLGSWDLLNDSVEACGEALSSVLVLPAQKYRLGIAGTETNKARRRKKYSNTAFQRLEAFLSATQECTAELTPEADALALVDGLDPGEANLFAQAAAIDGAIVATGDKRSIEALAGAKSCEAITVRLVGRVMCLEQMLLRTIDHLGFPEVRARIVESGALAMDTAVRTAFGSGMQADELNSCGNLERRVRTLAASTGSLLAAQSYRFEDK
jgi:hypothetical protein